ncbi:MAG: MarC family protein [Bergeyella zoohelcum]|nr:MarC family protein [Bergeyella zoohelcum]
MQLFEHFDIDEIVKFSMALFVVIDIIGSVPLIVSLKQKFGKIESEKTSLVSAIVMIVFLFAGKKLLEFIHVDVNAFAIAGAFVLFVIALEMILGIQIQRHEEIKSASIFPLAFPLIAGAGALTTIIAHKSMFHDINIVIGIILNVIVVYIVLRSANWIEKRLGKDALKVIERIFGIILLAVSIKIFTSNFAELLKSLNISV